MYKLIRHWCKADEFPAELITSLPRHTGFRNALAEGGDIRQTWFIRGFKDKAISPNVPEFFHNISERFAKEFFYPEYMMLNAYAHQASIEHHSDGYENVAILSFGNDAILGLHKCKSSDHSRLFEYHSEWHKDIDEEYIRLRSGDLIILPPESENYVHSVDNLGKRRFSLIFRAGRY